MRYGCVKDGKVIVGPRVLPKAWENISGLDKLSAEELADLGWLPWRFVEVNAPNEDWAMIEPTIEIFPTEIVETQTYRPKTAEEIEAHRLSVLSYNKTFRLQAYREEADSLFFKAERGEIPREEWLAKVEEIRNRYPT